MSEVQFKTKKMIFYDTLLVYLNRKMRWFEESYFEKKKYYIGIGIT